MTLSPTELSKSKGSSSASGRVYEPTRFSLIDQSRHFIREEIRFSWLAALALIAVAILFVKQTDLIELERLHTWAFLVVVLIAWQIPRRREVRLPGVLVVGCLVGWLASLWVLYGGLSAPSASAGVIFTRLENDHEELISRALIRRYDQIASTYDTPPASRNHNRFALDDLAAQWLATHQNVNLMLYGQSDWVKLRLAPNFPQSVLASSSVQLAKQQLEHAKRLQLSQDKRTHLVELKGTGAALMLVHDPEQIQAPTEPADLILHVLAWVAKGLSAETQVEAGDYDNALRHSLREDAFREAANIEGPWRSHAPRALADFLLATYLFVDAMDSPSKEESGVSCSLNSFRKAAGYLKGTAEPRMSGAVFNNAAVARVFLRDNRKNVAVAKKWLLRAAKERDAKGMPVFAAKVAMLNLRTLDRLFP